MDQKVWKKLYDKNGHLVYEGYTLLGKPFGRGTVYFPNGNKYQEGKFAEKGLVGYGKEYWSNGKLKVEAKFIKNRNYGPNYPSVGTFYNKDGVKVFSGRFGITRNLVGIGFVRNPKEYKENLPDDQKPEIHYFMWGDRFEMEHPYTGKTMACPICGTEIRVRKKYDVYCSHCGWRIATGNKHRPCTHNLFSLEIYKACWDHGVATYEDFKTLVRQAYTAMETHPDAANHIQKVFAMADVEDIMKHKFKGIQEKYGDSPDTMFRLTLRFAGDLHWWY